MKKNIIKFVAVFAAVLGFKVVSDKASTKSYEVVQSSKPAGTACSAGGGGKGNNNNE